MDDIYLPEETDEEEPIEFERRSLESEKPSHPSGVNASGYVKVTFGRFVELVARHSFEEVMEHNKNEEVILSTNLLTDLANAKNVSPNSRAPLMIVGGLVIGILFGYILFNGV